MKYYQQGDVLVKPCKKLPDDAKPAAATSRGIVLAYGEVTGHAHRIVDTAGVEFLESNGVFFIRNKGAATITHEEHGAVTVPPGLWEIGKVREYDHFAEEAREVRD